MAADRINVNRMVFIGAGNMAEALVKGMLASGVCTADRLHVTDVRSERLAFFEKEFHVKGSSNNKSAVKNADVVVLAVKPQVIGGVLDGFQATLGHKPLVISIAAGISTSWLEKSLGEGVRVVRAMPNTPALVRSGAAAICRGRWATDADFNIAEAMMRAVGVVVRVQEKDMDAVTALSGSGPAYVFHLMEAMIAAATHAGLDGDVARKLVYATVRGAAKLAEETGVDPAELRRRVTSKGGTTEAALEVLEEKSVYHAYLQAIAAAHRRSRELSGG
jgi:pyrroline-5-carboxylate reductase